MISTNKNRFGNFTSSQVSKLMGTPKPCKTYIQERNMERKLGRSLGKEVSSRPTSWGKLVEKRVFDLLGIEYSFCSQETIDHPTIESWKGSPDGFKGDAVIDIKCPQLKKFCELVEITTAEQLKEDEPAFYWQLVSNAVLLNKQFAELIVYVPYQSELDTIRIMCEDVDVDQLRDVYWINNSSDEELPFLVEGGHYINLNVLRFEVSEVDKKALESTIIEKSKELINFI
jgi:hypothetical protein